ncbi:hypothetical protein [Vampirovibrio sp.]|uniref:hypothetical protein n=1 Tax=Vampirovibrio sp. TaxID=2717857 RepID=UPI003593D22D
MKIATEKQAYPRPDIINRDRKAFVHKSPLASAVLFGKTITTSKEEVTPSDPKLEKELERLIQRAPKIFGQFFITKAQKPLFQKRAQYNLNQNPDLLTSVLPYRQILTQKNDLKHLKQYDALVNNIMNQAEFYEMKTLKPAKKAIHKLYNLQDIPTHPFKKNGIDTLWKIIKLYVSFPFSKQARNTLFKIIVEIMQENAKHISDQSLSKQVLQSGAEPLKDPSTRYLIASSISDILFKNPEQAKQLLTDSKHPLRFIIGKERAWASSGQFKPGFNLIFLNEESLWQEALKGMKRPYTSQHEFIHALSDSTGGEVLPSMSETQKNLFLKARTQLKTLHSRKDAGPPGWIRSLWNRHTATGLRGYAFFNDLEFLTVTLDTFKSNPQELCRTQPGKEIYQIYKEIFKLDPLQDFKAA